MIIKNGHVYSKTEYGKEVKKRVEEFIEVTDMTSSYIDQYIYTGDEILSLKTEMEEKQQINVLYLISIRRWFDIKKLRRLVNRLSTEREGVDRSYAYVVRKIDEYRALGESDEDKERAELLRNFLINYADMQKDALSKKVDMSKRYVVKIKQLEKIDDSVSKELDEIRKDLAKNKKTLRMVRGALKDLWLKYSDEAIDEIIENNEEVEVLAAINQIKENANHTSTEGSVE